jgi:integrase
VRLGKVSQRTAEAVKTRIEILNAAKIAGYAVDGDTAGWAADLDSKLYGKLVAVGLLKERATAQAPTVGAFLTEYVARRPDVKPATKEVWSQVQRNLLACFGGSRDLRTIDEAAAEDFKLFLLKLKLVPTTVHKRLQFARQFFRWATKRKLILANPFAEVTAKATMKPDRERFVTRGETARLLAACPNDWRVIVGLCRFGGLRCPSEVLTLRWRDIDWERGRINVTSPKTEHCPGKGSQEVPLFPDLRALLSDAFDAAPEGAEYDAAPEGAEYVVDGNHCKAANTPGGWRNCNMRSQFARIVQRAGYAPWPKPWQNLRSSRETELAETFPVQVVCQWIGNSRPVALEHYLQVTEEHFARATQPTTEAVQNPVQSAHVTGRTASQADQQECVFAEKCDPF